MRKFISVILALTIITSTMFVATAETENNYTTNIADIKSEDYFMLSDGTLIPITIDNNQLNTVVRRADETSLPAETLSLYDSKGGDIFGTETLARSAATIDYTKLVNFNTIVSPKMTTSVNEPKFSYNSFIDECISEYSGELTLNFEDLTLKGRNGLDLTIGRTYQSSAALMGTPVRMLLPDEDSPLGVSDYLVYDYSNYYNDRYCLGTGWSFSFPSVQVSKEFTPDTVNGVFHYDVSKELYYHTGNGEVYHVKFTADETDSNLENYYKKDILFSENDTGYTNSKNIQSYYSMTLSDKTKQYFAEDGRLLGLVDRFGNKIDFQHDEVPVTNRIPGGDFSCGEGMWTLSNDRAATLNTEVGLNDTNSMEVFTDNYGDVIITSQPVQVEPHKTYKFSTSFLSTYGGDDIKITFKEYDTLHFDNEEDTVYEINNLPAGNWYTYENDYLVTSSATRYVRMEICVENGSEELFIDNASMDLPKPLISKITDSIGRTVDFEYTGSIYKGDTIGDIKLTVKSPDATQTKTMLYSKGSISFGTLFALEHAETKTYWYLNYSDTEGSNGNSNEGASNNIVYYHYNGGKNSSNEFINLYHNMGSLIQQESDYPMQKPLLGIVEYKNRTRNYNYEAVRKYMGDNGYWDTLRVSSRYEQFNNYSTETLDAGFEGAINKVDYSYSGTYYDEEKEENITFNNEGGYPNYKFDDTTNLNEEWNCIKTSQNKETTTFSNAKIAKQKVEELPSGIVQTYYYTYDNTFKNQPTEIRSVISENGNTKELYTLMSYNSSGELSSTTKRISPDIKNNTELLPKYTQNYQYSPHGFITEKSYYQSLDGELITEKNTYDDFGRLTKTVTSVGEETEYIYGDNTYPGNVTALKQKDTANMHGIFPSEKNISYEYDAYGLYNTKTTETSGSVTSVTRKGYDYIYGNLLYTIYPDSSYEQFAYNENGSVAQYLSPYIQDYGNKIQLFETTSYNTSLAVQIGETYIPVLEQVATKKYIYYENLSKLVVYAITHDYYDTAGNLIYKRVMDFPHGTEDEEGNIVSTPIIASYNLFDNYDRLTTQINPKGNVTLYQYDTFDRIIKITDGENNTHNYSYDDLNLTRSYYLKDTSGTASNHITENYDVYGNTVSIHAYPNGLNNTALTEYFEYDLNGNVIKHTDGKGNITRYSYDKADRLCETVLPDGTKATSFYSKLNEPTTEKIISSDGKEKSGRISYYDERGNAKWKFYNYNNKLTDINTYEYDEKNRLISFSEGGYSNTYAYDDSNNLLLQKNGTSEIERFYNQFGVALAISNDSVASDLNYEYDKLGRLTLKQQLQYYPETETGVLFETRYDYDSLNNAVSSVQPSERTESYTYTPNNKLETITTDNKNITYDYYPSGYIKSITYPNGMITSYTYDNLNRVTAMQTVKGGNIINNLSYQYDANSNIISETRNNATTTYSYDSLDRLINVAYNNGKTVSYEYDTLGNRTKETTVTDNDTEVKEYIYNDRYQLTEIKTDGETTDTYTYNQRGAIKTHNNKTYTYDVWDKLSSVTENGTTHNFVYDTNGIRTQKDNTRYVVDASNNVIAEADVNGNITSETVWGHQPLARKVNNAWYYYIYNAHGDVIGLVSDSGTVVNSYEYDAWGNIVSETEAIDNPIKFAGEYCDSELSMYYLRARYYDPSIGRFTSYDIEEGSIANPQDMNRYVYCRNNPIKYVDSTGMFVVSTAVLVGISIGALVGASVGAYIGYKAAERLGVDTNDRWKFVAGYGLGGALIGGTIGTVIGYGIHAALGVAANTLPVLGATTNALNNISANTQHHIMQTKHAWEKVVSSVTFDNIRPIINTVITSGETTLTGKYGESMVYTAEKIVNGFTVRVTYAVQNGITTISNAYVVTK